MKYTFILSIILLYSPFTQGQDQFNILGKWSVTDEKGTYTQVWDFIDDSTLIITRSKNDVEKFTYQYQGKDLKIITDSLNLLEGNFTNQTPNKLVLDVWSNYENEHVYRFLFFFRENFLQDMKIKISLHENFFKNADFEFYTTKDTSKKWLHIFHPYEAAFLVNHDCLEDFEIHITNNSFITSILGLEDFGEFYIIDTSASEIKAVAFEDKNDTLTIRKIKDISFSIQDLKFPIILKETDSLSLYKSPSNSFTISVGQLTLKLEEFYGSHNQRGAKNLLDWTDYYPDFIRVELFDYPFKENLDELPDDFLVTIEEFYLWFTELPDGDIIAIEQNCKEKKRYFTVQQKE